MGCISCQKRLKWTSVSPWYEEAKYSVCANGEIYNFRKLQEKYGLTAAQTGSDSEVLLQLYRHMGRGLHSSTFRLNVSTYCWTGGAYRGCVGGV